MSITIRNFTWNDLPGVVEVMNLAAPNRPRPILVEDIEPAWRAPYHHPEQDCFVALSPENRLVGVAIADLLDQPNEANGVMWIAPDSIATTAEPLVKITDDYFCQKALANSPANTPIWINRSILDTDTAMIQILESNGYQLARYFYTMRINLEQPITPQPDPAGFSIRPINIETDAQLVYAAQHKAFQGHWGYYQTPYEEWIYPTTQPNFDSNLWLVVWDSDQVAGLLLGEVHNAVDGWISTVAVRPAWRKRGLALALLQRAFARYQERGMTRVQLGVDTENAQSAVNLYERAGMHSANCKPTYRKYFR